MVGGGFKLKEEHISLPAFQAHTGTYRQTAPSIVRSFEAPASSFRVLLIPAVKNGWSGAFSAGEGSSGCLLQTLDPFL